MLIDVVARIIGERIHMYKVMKCGVRGYVPFVHPANVNEKNAIFKN